MLYLILKELTKERAIYEYHPYGKEPFGIVSVDLNTGKCRIEKEETEAGTMFSTMALSGLRKMFKANSFPQRRTVAWY